MIHVHESTFKRLLGAASFALALPLALVAIGASAASENASLDHAYATFDRESFSAGWSISEFGAGWRLLPDQYRVDATGDRLRISFLPSALEDYPGQSALSTWGSTAPSGPGRFQPVVVTDSTWVSMPLGFQSAAGYAISGYRVSLAGEYVRSGEVNGVFVLTGSLGLTDENGAHIDVAQLQLAQRTPGNDLLQFAAELPATADFRTLSGQFQARFDLDPRPPGYTDYWSAVGMASSEFVLQSLTIDVLTSPIPEPSSSLLIFVGLATLVACRRRGQGRWRVAFADPLAKRYGPSSYIDLH